MVLEFHKNRFFRTRVFLSLPLVVMIVFLFTLPADLSAGIHPMTRQLLVPDSLNEKLNRLLLNELQKRIPKGMTYSFEEQPSMMPWHKLTDSVPCTIRLPDTKTKDPQEALNIYLSYAQAYVDTMNNVREVRPYLAAFPFSLNMWFFLVNFASNPETKTFFYAPYIAEVACCGGGLDIYRLHKEKRMPDGHVGSHIYDNAYETPEVLPVAIQQMAIPRFDVKKEPKTIPEEIKFCFPDDDGGKRIFAFFKKLAEHNGFTLLALDHVFCHGINYIYRDEGARSEKMGCNQVAFAAQEKYLNIDESKELVSKIRQEIITFSFPSEKLEDWVNLFRKEKKEKLSSTLNLQEYMSIRISFWDRYIDRVKQPYIAEIQVMGTKAKYYVADELQRLQLIYEEEIPSYEVEYRFQKSC